jgi:hypothetical protein
MSRQDDARRIAAGLKFTVTTTRRKVVAEVICPSPSDARRVLSAFGKEGWKTNQTGPGNKTVHAEVAL